MVAHEPEVTPASGLIAIFLDLRPALTRFLAVRGAQPAEAEDLLQDLFLKLRDMAPGPISEPRAYLYRMASNLMLDVRRSAVRRTGREEAWIGNSASAMSDVDPAPSAEAALLARERLQAVTAALTALPERTRDVFRRYRLNGESQKAIAAELAVSVSAVEKHLQRAYRAVLDARTAFDADIPMPRRLTGERDEHGA